MLISSIRGKLVKFTIYHCQVTGDTFQVNLILLMIFTREMKIEAIHPTTFLWQPDECWPNQHIDDVPQNDTELLAEKSITSVQTS